MVIEFRTKYLPPTHSSQMAGQYGVPPEVYIYDLKILSNNRYSQGMLFFILSFLKQQLKLSQVITATLMLYDFIYHIPQQVSFSICTQ